MKKIILAITVLSLLFLCSCSANPVNEETTSPVGITEDNSAAPSESLARVVEIPYENTAAVFTFNEKGLLISSENCPWGSDNDYYKYDEQNRITEIQHALWDGTIDDGCERNVYLYDEKGNIHRINTYTGSKDKLSRHRTYEFEYNTEGLVTKETVMAGGNNDVMAVTHNEYDENGRLIKAVTESYGSFFEVYYEYDSNGNCTLIDSNGERTVYEYNSEGRLIKEISDSYVSNYEYENGLLVKETTEDWYIEYKYFDSNRIIAAYFYSNDGISEINISAVPEVMGNYSDLTIAPFPG